LVLKSFNSQKINLRTYLNYQIPSQNKAFPKPPYRGTNFHLVFLCYLLDLSHIGLETHLWPLDRQNQIKNFKNEKVMKDIDWKNIGAMALVSTVVFVLGTVVMYQGQKMIAKSKDKPTTPTAPAAKV
jgi:hypothetical protein